LAKATGKAEPTSGERTLVPSSASGSGETLPGSALGTPAYMSPEQAEGRLDRLGPHSDAYSLGATLYCLLTGRPPFEGEVADVIRAVQRGEFRKPRAIDPAIDGALEAVCLKSMALKSEDRYGSCRALVEDIERWMADEPISAWREPRSRQARRWARRNRSLVTGAAAAVLAGVVGLAAVLAVQTRAKADLARSLANETSANQRLADANAELTRSHAAVRARYELAVEAIKTFHTGASEDFLLKEEQFKELHDRLLRSASDFYGRLGALLGKESDLESRRALAQANFEAAVLTGKVGQREAALAAHRQVLAFREALAAEAGSDAEIKADVGRSLTAVASLLAATGQSGEALATCRKAEGLLAEPAGTDPAPPSVRSALASCRSQLGSLLDQTGHADEGLAVLRLARADQEALASSARASTEARSDLAVTVHRIGQLLAERGKLAEAEAEHRHGLGLVRRLVEDNPTVTVFRYRLATSHGNLAILLSPRSRQARGTLLQDASRSAEAEAEFRQALVIIRKLVDDNSAVTEFRRVTVIFHSALGALLATDRSRTAEAEAEYRRALEIAQKLANEHPERFRDRWTLALVHHELGVFYSETDRPDEGEASLKQAIGIWERLTAEYPDLLEFPTSLALAIGEMAYVRRTRGDLQGDYDWLIRGERTIEDILRRAPDYTPARKRVAFDLPYVTKAAGRVGRHAEAIATCDRAIKLVDGEDRDRVRIQRVLAVARSGEYARATVEADRLAETTSIPIGERFYDFACLDALASAAARNDPKIKPAERTSRAEQLAARSVLLLDRSRIAGFFRHPTRVDQLMKDTDLESLRSRPDFQVLMMDVAFPAEPFSKDTHAHR
jgi:serine/threonine-protein kinase